MKKSTKIISIVLVCLLAVSAVFCGITALSYRSKYAKAEQRYNDVLTGGEYISVEQFRNNAERFGVGPEFIQSFFSDCIVFYGPFGLTFAPFDETIPENNYDWEELTVKGGFRSYEGGMVGIDVSQHQGEIDWEKVKASGVEFAMIRAGYTGYETGEQRLDATFKYNIEEALKNDVKVGVYFYTQAINTEEANIEADFVLAAIEEYDITLPVTIDVEPAPSESGRANFLDIEQQTEIIKTFCEKIKAAGYQTMIYANTASLLESMYLSEVYMYGLWLAQYYKTPFFPYDFAVWQHTSQGQVDGIEGNVDLNIMFKKAG